MAITAKRCQACGGTKELDEFHRNASNATDGRKGSCKPCTARANRIRYERNPAPFRWNRIKHLYGLTEQGYQELYDAQQGCCAVCGRHENDCPRRGRQEVGLNIDHNHDTGQVRGLLCVTCNLAIGYLEAASADAEAVVSYLRRR